MIEKDISLEILQDIQNILKTDNIEKSLKTLDIYRKNLELSCNKDLAKLIEKQKNLINTYGENDNQVLKINKKIDKQIRKIFNS